MFSLVSIFMVLKEALRINALRACVYIYARQLSSFRALSLWLIDLTVATFHTRRAKH